VSTRDGVIAFVYSSKFQGMGDMDRQDAIWDLLVKGLDREEHRAVAIVVALTPQEHIFHSAGRLD
jgi:acid stress-induced BolA-like protein IbaG/YrbA